MSEQAINVTLALRTAQALEQLNGFLVHAGAGLVELAGQVAATYVGLEGLHKIDELVKSSIELQEQVGRISDKTGLSVNVIESIRERSEKLNTSLEQINTTMRKFGSAIYEGATVGGEFGKVFEKMGVALVDADGKLRTTDAILGDTAQWFSKHAAGAEKARFATVLFGRAGAELIPILNEGREEIERMASTKGPISDASVAASEKFEMTLRAVRVQVELLGVQVANQLLPTIQNLADKLLSTSKNAELVNTVVTTLADIVKGLVSAVLIAGLVFYQFSAAIGYAAEMLVTDFKASVEVCKTLLNSLQDSVADVLADTAGMVDRFFQSLDKQWGHGSFKQLWKDTIGDKADYIDPIQDAMSGIDAAVAKVKANYASEDALGQDFIDRSTAQWKKLGDFISGMFRDGGIKPANKPGGTAKDGEFIGPTAESLKAISEWDAITQEIYKQNLKLIEADPFKSEAEKIREELPLLTQRRSEIEKEMEAQNRLRVSAINSKDSDKELAASKELVKLRGQLIDLDSKLQKDKSFTSFGDQFSMELVKIQNSFGSLAKQTASTFGTVFNNACNTISSNITKLIEGTKTWGQALREIGTSIVDSIIQGLVNIIVKMVMLAIVTTVAKAAGLSTGNDKPDPATAAAWGGEAMMRSIADLGPVAGPIAFFAESIAGAAMGTAISGRAVGGPVDGNTPYIVGERGPELFVPRASGTVMTASQTSAMMKGSAPAGQSSQGNGKVDIFPYFDMNKVVDAVHKSTAGEKHIVDVMSRNIHKFR